MSRGFFLKELGSFSIDPYHQMLLDSGGMYGEINDKGEIQNCPSDKKETARLLTIDNNNIAFNIVSINFEWYEVVIEGLYLDNKTTDIVNSITADELRVRFVKDVKSNTKLFLTIDYVPKKQNRDIED